MSLADDLVACGALRFGDFTLSSGRKSRYYVDKMAALTRPDILRRVAEAMAPHAEGHARLAGTELGAVPLLAAVSLVSGLPYVILRKGTKGHGTDRAVEGALEEGDRVLLVEDVTTTGGTLRRGVEVLRGRGATVERAVCMVDREEGATERLAEVGVALIPLVRARELLERAEG